MSGGGVGNVLSTGASLAAGQSPIGAFGSALGSQLLSGGGGGGGGPGAPGGNIGGIGRQNQTQITGPYAGMNPASIAYQQEMQRAQQQQMQPQVQPQVLPQVQQPLQGLFGNTTQADRAALLGGVQQPTQTQLQQIQQGMEQLRQQPMGGGVFSQGQQPFERPLVQQPFGGGRLGAPDLSQDAYNRHMATALYRAGTAPTYEQWVQQSSAPKPMPAVFPPKPGVFGPQVQPDRRILPMPATQTRPAQSLGGLAGLAGMLKGRQ
jgi:hypothetical protein